MPPIKLSRVTFAPPDHATPTPPPPPTPAPGLPPAPEPPVPGGPGGVDVAGADTSSAEIPAALVERLLAVVDATPGLTLGAAVTVALEQFLASLPVYDQ